MKRLIKLTLFVLVLHCCIACSVDANATAKGICGKEATYEDDGKGTMTISGKGVVDSLPTQPQTNSGGSESLKKIVISEGITSINVGLSKWIYLNSIESVVLPDTIQDIGSTFSGTKIKEIILPQGIKVLGDKSFYNCAELKNVVLSNNLVEIGDSAFCRCTKLSEIVIPKSVIKIGKNALENADNLMRVDNKSSVVCELPTKREGSLKLLQTFFVDGKQVTSVPANKIAIGKWNSYKVTLKLAGGKLIGKGIKYHVYNTEEKLPKARKKGYIFCGWLQKNSGYDVTCDRISSSLSRAVTFKAIFKKVVKKKTKKKTTLTLKNAIIGSGSSHIVVKVSNNKKMDKSVVFKIEMSKNCKKNKRGISCNYVKKNKDIIITIKKRKGKFVKVSWGDSGDSESTLKSPEYLIAK
ncbi:leucine-rich repeat domain-containing protein [Eubacterium xylanophilum]|uniref:leucine-rich repeat domain-containing protein n=1 Tax=Eubacterium xylanophilum TaxID=39497 RepID=UPI00047D41A8|nr:leucine-rich repeat domain-containing protein [Eubacterium xylanophilum]